VKIIFRPHHFLCTLGFQGKGYSPDYVKNYASIVEALLQNEDLEIEVVAQSDSICAACPHEREGECEQENKVQVIDKNHSNILGVKSGDVVTWRQAKQLMKNKMTVAAFHKACEGCKWQPMGMCEAALKQLRDELP